MGLIRTRWEAVQLAPSAPPGFRALIAFALTSVLVARCGQARERGQQQQQQQPQQQQQQQQPQQQQPQQQPQPPPPQRRTHAQRRVTPPVPEPATKPPRLVAAPPEPEVLRFAVLPLEPLLETTDSNRRFAQRKLKEHLQDHPKVELIAAAKVAQAMTELGVVSPSKCDQRCLIRLGRRLGAHRVLGGTVRMQKKVQSKGTVWEFSADLVHVQRGTTWGHYQTVCHCWRGQQDRLLRRQVHRMLTYHPDRWILKMTQPTPVPAPANAPRTPGMVYVPAGEFIMGSEYGEADESPRHVVLTDAFFIDQYEVTNARYDRCVTAHKCVQSTTRADPKYSAPRQPVAGVGFKDAVAYCRFAGKRLLTEAEWEKAARGTDERIYPWGNTWNYKWLNLHWEKDGFATTAPVGSFPKNVSPFGAYDMAGNVWEWTSDLWHPTSYRHSPHRNPRGHKRGDANKRRVMRGGTWMYDVPFFTRTHNRSPGRPWIRKRYVGIRCGKDAPPLPGR